MFSRLQCVGAANNQVPLWLHPWAGGSAPVREDSPPPGLPLLGLLAAASAEAAAGTLLLKLTASWLCSWHSAAPHLSPLGPTRMLGVGVRPGRSQVRKPGPLSWARSRLRSFVEPRDWEPNKGCRSLVTVKLPLGAGRKAVNTVASGDRSRTNVTCGFLI